MSTATGISTATAARGDAAALLGSLWRISSDAAWEDLCTFGEAIDHVISSHAHCAALEADGFAETDSLDLPKVVAQMCAHAAADSDDIDELHALLEELPDIRTGRDVTIRRMS